MKCFYPLYVRLNYLSKTNLILTINKKLNYSHLNKDVNLNYEKHCDNIIASNKKVLEMVNDSVKVIDDFVTVEEETNLMNEIEPCFKRSKYETSHWDDAIANYRETEKINWNSKNRLIIERIRKTVFPLNFRLLRDVHILDLAENGHIKPHIDSVRFCGSIIAGLSLNSSSVMRLTHENDENLFIDMLLKQRSLYVIKDIARYKFKHEIFGNEKSFFNNIFVHKRRRISLVNRCESEEV